MILLNYNNKGVVSKGTVSKGPCQSIYVCLQEKLPDFDHYSTVDGVIVWPQLAPSTLTSSQSSDNSFNVSAVMEQDVSPQDVSPGRPLSTKDINTEIQRVKMSPSRKPRIQRSLPDRTASGALCCISLILFVIQ